MTSPTFDRRQGLVGNTPIKAPVDLATTGPLTLNGEQIVDGMMTSGSRVLVKDQADTTTNGIYDTSSGNWTLAQDSDGNYDLAQGTLVLVNGGSANASSIFSITSPSPLPGSTSIVWRVIANLMNLASSIGASLVGFLQAGVGAVLRSIQDELRDTVKPQQFGVTFNGVTDDTAAWAKVTARAAAIGGGTGVKVVCPPGDSILTALTMPKGTIIVGQGRLSTQLIFTGAGDGIVSTCPINSSTGVRSGLRDIGVININGANVGGGYVDIGGTYVDLKNVFFQGWKYDAIFDQTEIATVDQCEFLQFGGQVGIWIVNGPDHTAGANTGYTNRITIARSQFNGSSGGLENIRDDGGGNHSIVDNNFNGGTCALRAAGVLGLRFQGNESEGHLTNVIHFASTTASGAYVGPCSGVSVNAANTFSDIVADQILIDDLTHAEITNNVTGQATSAFVAFSAGSPATDVIVDRNAKLVLGAGHTAAPFISVPTGQIARNNKLLQAAHTISAGAITAGSVAVTPATMEAISIGTRLVVINADGTAGEGTQVTNVTSTTFSATFANAHTANFIIRGVTTQDEQELTWTPLVSGQSTAGVLTLSAFGTLSRRGNLVHAKFNIACTATGTAMVGAVQITGLPFVAESIANQAGICTIAGFSGFTFATGFTQLGGTIQPGASAIVLLRSGSGEAFSNVLGSEAGTTFTLIGEVIFYTSSV